MSDEPIEPPSAAPPKPEVRLRPAKARGLLRVLARSMIGAAILVAVLCLSLAATGWYLAGKPVALPVWAVSELQSRINRSLQGRAVMSLGGVELQFSASSLPELRLEDLLITPAEGGGSIRLPTATARFDGGALLLGQIKPVMVGVMGPHIALRRLRDGSFDLDLGQTTPETPMDFAATMTKINEILALPALSKLERVEAQAITVTLDDRRAGRVWTMGDGRTTLVRQDGETVLDLGVGLVGGGATPATAQLTFRIRPDAQGLRLAVRVDNVAAADLAMQAPLLSWLQVMDAPISGDLRTEFDGAGQLTLFEGSMSLGKGALQPVPGIRPVPLNRADLVFALDPKAARFTVSQMRIESDALRVTASAHSDLIGFETGVPESFLTQVKFQEVAVDPEGVFTEPVRFSEGALDLRLRLDPFSVDVGQLVLVEEDRHLSARGGVKAGVDGWTVAMDLELDRIRHDRLLALWPIDLVAKTRAWLVDNVQEGVLFDVKAGLRMRPGQEPRLSLGYEFAGADVRFMRTLPPIQNGRGYAVIENQTYLTVVEGGYLQPPEGGRIDVSRSVFRVPDITVKPPPSEISLQTESSVTAALSLLDQPPFNFLSKAKLKPDLADGRASLQTELRLPLARKVAIQDVQFSVKGDLTEVRSDRLVPGRLLTSDHLRIEADPTAVSVLGQGRLGQAGFDARWKLPLGPGSGASQVTGDVRLDAGFAAEFLAALPANTLSGDARGALTIDIPKGGAPQLTLTSDLVGAAVRIGEIGWTKPAGSRGKLEVSGTLRAPQRFDRLVLEGPGLVAEGAVALGASGTLESLNLSRVKLGDWLEASAVIEGRGRGNPVAVRLTGGSLDVRKLPQGGMGGGGGRGGRAPIDVALDRVSINDAIALTRVRGQLSTGAPGMNGTFQALLNGEAPISAQLVPWGQGTAYRLRAQDGGAVLRAAKIFAKAHGGALDVTLAPNGAAGHYDGNVNMTGFTVRDMPALAELLNAVSIVGLIDQLQNSGLVFSQALGKIRMTPDAIEVSEGSAVGASFGVSLEGVYYTRADQLDLQGVISPFYLINGIGSVLTRPGEGVLGFTYRVRGSAKDAQVSVNPLSVLAPSFFRDLLRRPAARLDQ